MKKRNPKRSQNWKPAFLAAYAAGQTMSRAAELAGMTRQGVQARLLKDVEFASQFEVAGKQSADALEQEARRRAIEGVQRKKFHQGLPIMDPITGKQYEEREFSDTLLIFLMKGRNPTVFGDKVDHTTGGKAISFTLNIGKSGNDGTSPIHTP